MKKVFLALLFVGISLTSCDSDDDNSSSDLVGTWQLTSEMDRNDGDSDVITVQELTPCDRRTTIVLTEDTITTNSYELESEEGEAVEGEEEEEEEEEGICELNIESRNYTSTATTITLVSFVENGEPVEDDETETVQYTITDNILTIFTTSIDGEDDENSTITFQRTFTRIN